jgi:hypothetical protein
VGCYCFGAGGSRFWYRVDEDWNAEVARDGFCLRVVVSVSELAESRGGNRWITCSSRESLRVPAELETIRTLLAPNVFKSSSQAGCSDGSSSSTCGRVCMRVRMSYTEHLSEAQMRRTMQLSLSRTTPVTPRCLNRAKSSEVMEGALRVGWRMLGLNTACTVALMPTQLAISLEVKEERKCWAK